MQDNIQKITVVPLTNDEFVIYPVSRTAHTRYVCIFEYDPVKMINEWKLMTTKKIIVTNLDLGVCLRRAAAEVILEENSIGAQSNS